MTTTTTRETTIEADPTVPLIRIVREFDAPPEKVFRAHTDPELLVQWLGPHGLEMTVEHFDCRTGGSYRYTHRDANGEYRFHGSFHDVRPDDNVVVQTFTYDACPDAVALERLTLEDLGGGRTLLVVTSLCDSFEGRDAALASGMDVGIREGYERLDALLAR